jgi:hypothetical protein
MQTYTVTEEDIERSSTLEPSDIGRKYKLFNGCMHFVTDNEYPCTECGGITDGGITWDDGSGYLCQACADADADAIVSNQTDVCGW